MTVTKPTVAAARVLIVGDVMLDRYWFGDVSRISPEAPVPVVRIERHEERLGGAANVARNVAALEVCAGLLGVVGNDEAGDQVQALLSGLDVTSYLNRDPGISTIVKLRVIGRQQQLLRIDFESPPTDIALRQKQTQYNALLPEYDIVVLSDYAKGGLANVAEMIASARKLDKCILVDPKGEDFSRYHGATVLTPNKAELRRVAGSWRNEEELRAKAEQLRAALDLQALLLTRSEEGMTLFTSEHAQHFAAEAREVYDVSGAGDTVIATLAAMLAAGSPLPLAVAMANRAGGIVVGKLGTATVARGELFK